MTDFDVTIAPSTVFRIVRAFKTSKEVREKTGVFVNFSAKVLHVGKKNEETPILSLNALSVRVSRDNIPFIASMGQKIDNGMIWSIQFFPGAGTDKDQATRQEEFVKKVIGAVNEFAFHAKQQYEERIKNNKLPAALEGLIED